MTHSASIYNTLNADNISSAFELEIFIKNQFLTFKTFTTIANKRDYIRLAHILSNLNAVLNREDFRGYFCEMPESVRKQYDDVLLGIIDPAQIPYSHKNNYARDEKDFRELALRTLLKANTIDPRTHNSRKSFHEIVLGVVGGLLQSDATSDTIKHAYTSVLIDLPRLPEIASVLTVILVSLDRTPNYTDYDGRPYPNHWARDALEAIASIIRPDATYSSTRGAKPAGPSR